MGGRLSGLEKSYGFWKVLGLRAIYGIMAALGGVSEDLYSVSCKGPGT